MSDVELLPCPFCGNDHIAIGYSDHGYQISCFRGGDCCKSSTGIWPTEAEAIAAWNCRQASAAPQQAIPEGYVLMPKELTAENGAKATLSGEFAAKCDHGCPECADAGEVCEDCEVCGGDGYIPVDVPVEWDTIKAIYRKAVATCAKPAKATGEAQ